jgi:flagellar assembly protein FliH
MILRGAKVSERAVRVVADTRRLEAPPSSSGTSPSVPVAQVVVEDRPKLDSALVRKWLAEQGDALRREVALELAPEIAAEYAASRTQGWKEGRDEAAAKAGAEREAQAATIAQLSVELRSVAERHAAALAASCAEIVLEVLKKIAGPALATPEAVQGAVAQILRRVKDATEVVIRVRPGELKTLELARPALVQALGDADVSLVADQRVQLGGCIVESKLGTLDGRLEVQLAELCETIRSAKAEGAKP